MPSDGHHHHHDCPAAGAPRPCLKAAPIPAVVAPDLDLSLPAAVVLPDCPAAPAVFDEPPPVRPPVPLFLSLLHLRN